MLLQHLLDEGLSKMAIAQRLGVSRRVIYHWIYFPLPGLEPGRR